MKTKLLFLLALSISFLATAQFTAIPDSNFEDALQSLGYDSGVNDGQVLTANINTITNLDINSKNISDLTGIEDFVALELLWFYTNTVSSVDLSQNTNLKSLSAGGNSLTSLDVTKNIKLETLSVVNNNISTIDVSKNIELINFGITNNGLVSIDLSNNIKLQAILIGNNDLTNLNLSKNTALISLTCDLMPNLVNLDLRNGNNNNVVAANFLNNPKLSCILVDNPSFSTTTWAGAYASTTRFVASKSGCGESYTNIPDDNFEQALIDLGYDDELDDYVTTANINIVTSLSIANKSIADLTGIEAFTAMTFLGVNNNNLTTVDLSNNLNLENLSIYNNNLTSLDVSKNVKLYRINCDNNQTENLDFSFNPILRDISVNNNSLKTLNIQNGNNLNFTYFRANTNPELTCIQVDNKANSDNWGNVPAINTGKDATANYSEECTVNISGTENFEDDVVGTKEFTLEGKTFTLTGDLFISEYPNFSCGGGNTGVNQYLDSGLNDGASTGTIGSIIAPAGTSFILSSSSSQCGWPGTNDGNGFSTGKIKFIGTKTDNTIIEEEIEITSTSYTTLYSFSLSSTIWDNNELKMLTFEIISGMDYWAMDNLVLEPKTLSVDNVEVLNTISFYPNPAKESITINGLDTKAQFKIYNVLGVELINGTISNNETINIQNLKKGVYFIKIDSRKNIKFIKE